MIFHTRLYAGRRHADGRSYFYNWCRKKHTILKSFSSSSKILTMLPKTWILPSSEHGGSNSKRHFSSPTVNIHIVSDDFIETVHFFHQANATSDKVQRVQYHLELRTRRHKFMHSVLFIPVYNPNEPYSTGVQKAEKQRKRREDF